MSRNLTLAITLLAATSTQAEPYCQALLTGEGLEAKYARLAPIHSDTESGWIFPSDQLKDRYDLKSSARELVVEIVHEFDKRGIPLVILVPPPRPIVAGRVDLSAAMGDDSYDFEAAEQSFDALKDGLNEAGAIAPNLQEVALSDPDIRKNFYFRRDIHWTTHGALMSASKLAEVVSERHPDLFSETPTESPSNFSPSDEIEERGSLADIVRKACDFDPGSEKSTTFELPISEGWSLLGDAPERPSVALVGSSFSDRYKRDFYRAADALAYSLNTDVENLSVSGGGAIGAIEAYVLSGALEAAKHDMVIWEIPYTQSFNSVSHLRQLLGALRFGSEDSQEHVQTIEQASFKIPTDKQVRGLEIVTQDIGKQDFRIILTYNNGSTSKLSMRRSNSVPVEMRSDSLFFSLEHTGSRIPSHIEVIPRSNVSFEAVRVFY